MQYEQHITHINILLSILYMIVYRSLYYFATEYSKQEKNSELGNILIVAYNEFHIE